jgi:hypothetical protein
MKGKYVTLQVLLASLPKPAGNKKDIHAQLEETIAERKRIMQQLENLSRAAHTIDIYLGHTQAA